MSQSFLYWTLDFSHLLPHVKIYSKGYSLPHLKSIRKGLRKVVVKSTYQRSGNPLPNTHRLQQEKDFHIQPASHRFFCSGVSFSKRQF